MELTRRHVITPRRELHSNVLYYHANSVVNDCSVRVSVGLVTAAAAAAARMDFARLWLFVAVLRTAIIPDSSAAQGSADRRCLAVDVVRASASVILMVAGRVLDEDEQPLR
jgi:hypothetical protein